MFKTKKQKNMEQQKFDEIKELVKDYYFKKYAGENDVFLAETNDYIRIVRCIWYGYKNQIIFEFKKEDINNEYVFCGSSFNWDFISNGNDWCYVNY